MRLTGYEECDVVLGYGRENKADILNPYTAENIIKNTLEQYYNMLHEYFGSVIIGFNITPRSFTDKLTWSYGMDEDWMAAGGDISSLVSLLIEPKVKKQRREASSSTTKCSARKSVTHILPLSQNGVPSTVWDLSEA